MFYTIKKIIAAAVLTMILFSFVGCLKHVEPILPRRKIVKDKFYKDADKDGYGDPNAEFKGFLAPAGYVDNNYDCDDTDEYINPSMKELPNDGVDQDCDGYDKLISSFEAVYGGISDENGYSVAQTSDGGYILLGKTCSFRTGSCDMYLVKTNGNGTELWSKTYGSLEDEVGYSVAQTSDGGYILLGKTWSFGAGNCDMYLIKTDKKGKELWSKTFGGNNYDAGRSLQKTSDGGFILLGTTMSYGSGRQDMYLVKTDANGKELWSKTFGSMEDESGYSVVQTSDGGYILLGYTEEYINGNPDMFLVKTDASGNTLWSKVTGEFENDKGFAVLEAADGGYMLLGHTYSSGSGLRDMYLVKTDAKGEKLWGKTFGGSKNDSGSALAATSDGGYILLGYTSSFGAKNWDMFLVKTDAAGDEQWSKTIGGDGADWGFSVQQTSDGRYILLGITKSLDANGWDMFLVKTGPGGSTD